MTAFEAFRLRVAAAFRAAGLPEGMAVAAADLGYMAGEVVQAVFSAWREVDEGSDPGDTVHDLVLDLGGTVLQAEKAREALPPRLCACGKPAFEEGTDCRDCAREGADRDGEA